MIVLTDREVSLIKLIRSRACGAYDSAIVLWVLEGLASPAANCGLTAVETTDTARLDWLEANKADVAIYVDGWSVDRDHAPSRIDRNAIGLRDAIDTAMKEKREG